MSRSSSCYRVDMRSHRSLVLSFAVLAAPSVSAQGSDDARPNIVYILADDLGYGELGCYGQTKIKTPNIDALAADGMRFLQHYSGAPVCAPSRCVLMTGRHLSHAWIRGNKRVDPEGQWPIPTDAVTVAELLRDSGYTTGCIGKWGLGPAASTGDPNAQGFDFFYGYICQRQAHNYFPSHLWLNGERHLLANRRFPAHQKVKDVPEDFGVFLGEEYAPDLMANAALGFIREHQDRPFFLYLPFVEPHLAMQPPQRWVDAYPESWDEKPYLGTRGYTPHPRPRAGYAAMISHLDEHVGRVMKLLDDLDLTKNTLVIFSSDNGATHDVGGVETEFFDSVGGLRGRKGSVYEGGLRVPMVARWPGRIAPGTTSDHISGFVDVLPTLMEVAGEPALGDTDGVSFLPTLLGRDNQAQHDHLIWEFHGYRGQQAIRMGKWKAVRQRLHKGNEAIELYDLDADPEESVDLAASHPDLIERFDRIFRTDRTPNPDFPVKMLDG